MGNKIVLCVFFIIMTILIHKLEKNDSNCKKANKTNKLKEHTLSGVTLKMKFLIYPIFCFISLSIYRMKMKTFLIF